MVANTFHWSVRHPTWSCPAVFPRGNKLSPACSWMWTLGFGHLSHTKILLLNTVGTRGVSAILCGVCDNLAHVSEGLAPFSLLSSSYMAPCLEMSPSKG